jgi:hypothetical protein
MIACTVLCHACLQTFEQLQRCNIHQHVPSGFVVHVTCGGHKPRGDCIHNQPPAAAAAVTLLQLWQHCRSHVFGEPQVIQLQTSEAAAAAAAAVKQSAAMCLVNHKLYSCKQHKQQQQQQ